LMLWVMSSRFESALWLVLLFLAVYNVYNFLVGIVEHFKKV
jgi:hypothetical protein